MRKIFFLSILLICLFPTFDVYATTTYQQYQSGDIIYFDPILNKRCNQYQVENSNTLVKEGCMKWYVLKDEKELETVDIILDHNTSNQVYWSTNIDSSHLRTNVNGPKEILEQLALDTSKWSKDLSQKYKKTYKTNQSQDEYLIDYSSSKARLLTADEVAEITHSAWSSITAEVTKENESNDGFRRFFLDTQLTKEKPTEYHYGWLYDRTSMNCKNYGCLNNSDLMDNQVSGFWTDTALNTNQELAWGIDSQGSLYALGINQNTYFGIRPIITIEKEKINKEVVKVEDTLKTSYFGLCIGIAVLLLGQIVLYQALRKEK